MIKNAQSARSLTAFLVTWAFIVLTVTGLVLYVVPQGRVAYWVHWSLLGMEKHQWAWVHMMFGGVLIVSGVLHLYFNWKPFMGYFAKRVKGHLQVKREIVIATVLTVLIFGLSVLNLPPASWVFELNAGIKDSWVTSADLEPPFGHAEEVSLATMARRIGLDLGPALRALREQGIRFDSEKDSLEAIARANGITPMDVYAVIRPHRAAADQPRRAVHSREDIEARYAGTGLGRKALSEMAQTLGVETATAMERLRSAGIEAAAEDTARKVADRHGISPIDLAVLMSEPANQQ